MSFLVIVASLIAFMVLIIIEKMLIFIERIRNRKVDTCIISDWYRLSVHHQHNYYYLCSTLEVVQCCVKFIINISEYWI